MIVTCQDPVLKPYAYVAEKVAEMLRLLVINKALLSDKMSDLEVRIKKSTFEITLGFFSSEFIPEERKNRYAIEVSSKADEDEMIVAFVTAHEFAHLLFVNNLDVLKLGASVKAGVLSETVFIRTEEDGETWGEEAEEYAADALARFIVHMIYKGQYTPAYEAYLATKAFRFEVIESYERNFGKSLMDCEYIDEFTVVSKENGKFGVSISNLFWYSVSTFSTAISIDLEENENGTGNTYRRLCRLLKKYEKSPTKANRQKVVNFLKKVEAPR